MFSRLVTLISIASICLATPAGTALSDFVVNGSGCPPGSFSTSTDGNALRAKFTKFAVQVGRSGEPLDARANCVGSFRVSSPKGWQFAPRDVVYRGSLTVSPGVTASRTSYYYFQGELAQETITASESGPLNATDITLVDTFKQSAGYSKCGGSDVVNINIAIALDNGASSAYGYSRLTSAELGDFVWRTC